MKQNHLTVTGFLLDSTLSYLSFARSNYDKFMNYGGLNKMADDEPELKPLLTSLRNIAHILDKATTETRQSAMKAARLKNKVEQ